MTELKYNPENLVTSDYPFREDDYERICSNPDCKLFETVVDTEQRNCSNCGAPLLNNKYPEPTNVKSRLQGRKLYWHIY